MNEIAYFLQQAIGLHAPTIGFSAVESVVRSRMRILGVTDVTSYLSTLRDSSAELNALIDLIVVTETWFFRDKEPFTALVRFVKQEWLPTSNARPLRILSLPCSSGEEPYSIAMALLDAGLSPTRFQIDAVDISQRVLTAAERGVYQRNSFRTRDLRFRNRHFQSTQDGFLLNSEVRKQVRFCRGNLLDANFTSGQGRYDYIFCRNLLIYFDRSTQQAAFKTILDLLLPEGSAFFGSAELSLALTNGFVSAQIPLSFACKPEGSLVRKQERIQFHTLSLARFDQKSFPLTLALEEFNKRPLPSRRLPPNQQRFSKAGEKPQIDLGHARKLTMAGLFSEAENICKAFLQKNGASAEAYYLLGRGRDVAGANAEADELYRRALYLEPDHYDTLIQLASLCQRNGHETKARILLERAQRVKNQI
jgi:chemotaxis protein methyltransferase WspC